MRVGTYLSDLHMFSRRSQHGRYARAIPEAIAESQLCVLGGDIFDFRWTTLSGVEETVERGIGWLVSLIEANPSCDIHYVLGNHDHTEPLMDRLQELSVRYETFEWHRYYFRCDDKFFLHGDVTDWAMDHDELVRRRSIDTDRKKHRASHYAYDLAIHARLHTIPAYVWHSPRQSAARILHYVDTLGGGHRTDLRHIYFGHTHRAFSDFACEDLLFHNGGAPIRGLPFEILRFEL